MVSLAQLRAFTVVAGAGSVSRAAQLMGVSQPAVTNHIRNIENICGADLFVRTGHGVSLTTLGQALYDRTESLIDIEQRASELIASSSALSFGELSVACGAPDPAMALLAAFRARHPGVNLNVSFGNWDQVTSAVFERRADVGVLTCAPRDPNIKVQTVVAQRVVALVPESHKLANRTTIRFTDLRDEPVIFRTRQSLTQKTVNVGLAELGLQLTPIMTLETREAVFEAVNRALGIGFMFDRASVRSGGVARIPIDDLPDTYGEDVFCIADKRQSRSVSAFFDVAVDLAGQLD